MKILTLSFLSLHTIPSHLSSMTSDSGDRRAVRGPQIAAPEPEQHLPCPRCDSTNTKFCYYNNYNLSQPRHFCKSCRRYWTQGGTLRDIPVGGGTRSSSSSSKTHSNKRSRTTATNPSSAPHVSVSRSDISAPILPLDIEPLTSFSSLLATSSPGLLTLGEPFMNRAGTGLEGMGFGLGRGGGVWQMGEGVDGGGGNTWQVGIGDGFGDGDCFPWPDLAISTPGSGCLQ